MCAPIRIARDSEVHKKNRRRRPCMENMLTKQQKQVVEADSNSAMRDSIHEPPFSQDTLRAPNILAHMMMLPLTLPFSTLDIAVRRRIVSTEAPLAVLPLAPSC